MLKLRGSRTNSLRRLREIWIIVRQVRGVVDVVVRVVSDISMAQGAGYQTEATKNVFCQHLCKE